MTVPGICASSGAAAKCCTTWEAFLGSSAPGRRPGNEYQGQQPDRFGPMLLGVFPLMVMFVVTSVATLRERTTGTL
jgi:hypothetical protein